MPTSSPPPIEPPPEDIGSELLALVCKELKRRLVESPKDFTASEFENVRKLLADNAITLASIRRGSFGPTAKAIAEEFPFPADEDDGGRVMQ